MGHHDPNDHHAPPRPVLKHFIENTELGLSLIFHRTSKYLHFSLLGKCYLLHLIYDMLKLLQETQLVPNMCRNLRSIILVFIQSDSNTLFPPSLPSPSILHPPPSVASNSGGRAQVKGYTFNTPDHFCIQIVRFLQDIFLEFLQGGGILEVELLHEAEVSSTLLLYISEIVRQFGGR